MAYSVVGIINLALGRIGEGRITSLTENTPQAIAANASWEYIRDEVLSDKEWKFAKRRMALAKSTASPINVDIWKFVYPLPEGFLRICKGTEQDPAVYPAADYILEILSSDDGDIPVLYSNYDNDGGDLFLTYIQKSVDPDQYTPAFINALAFRHAAELSLVLTSSPISTFESMYKLYQIALYKAEGLNRSLDYFADEFGNNSWVSAGGRR